MFVNLRKCEVLNPSENCNNGEILIEVTLMLILDVYTVTIPCISQGTLASRRFCLHFIPPIISLQTMSWSQLS